MLLVKIKAFDYENNIVDKMLILNNHDLELFAREIIHGVNEIIHFKSIEDYSNGFTKSTDIIEISWDNICITRDYDDIWEKIIIPDNLNNQEERMRFICSRCKEVLGWDIVVK